ncbi:MAG: protein-glutamate O-methyltransferase CheR [Thermodesulfobacteria bacterium]|nr:protein-glutamate O-methyltransferase CheR [Thermodesulfobacteriota bacterium]
MNPEQFRFFSTLVKESSGIALSKGKEYLLESRLNELARVLGLRDINELYRKAKFNPSPKLKEQIIEAMTTNETYFFRDQHPFEALRKEIIPELIEKRKDKKTLRFWSAACSTGQEPYSIAIILEEHFPQLKTWRREIIASDISQQAIDKGKEGRFTQVEVNRGLPIQLLIKYFKQQGAFWIVDQKLKRLIRFKKVNLMGPLIGISNIDVVMCRYVLIYFDQKTKQAILEKIVKVLNPGGYLFLGATETPVGLPSCMKRKTFGRSTCWQKQ